MIDRSPRPTLAVAVGVGLVASSLSLPLGGTAFHATGPPVGHTGGFEEPTCLVCHMEFDLNLAGSLELEGLPDRFEPGASYVLTLALRSSEMERAGFQATARFGTGHQAGELRPLDQRTLVLADTISLVQYLQHAPTLVETDDPDFVSWSFEWSAPAVAGTVSFHAAANSANGDNSPLGDIVYATAARVESAGTRR